jgi:hypothetical protein
MNEEEKKHELIEEILDKIQQRGEYETIFGLIEMITELQMTRDELVKVLIDVGHIKPVPERSIPEEWIS